MIVRTLAANLPRAPPSLRINEMLERRIHPRRKVSLPARLLDANDCITPCRVLEISAEGACIRIGPPYAFLPRTFKLAIDTCEDPTRRTEVIWRRGVEVGVYFLSESELSASSAVPSTPARADRAGPMSVAELRKLVK